MGVDGVGDDAGGEGLTVGGVGGDALRVERERREEECGSGGEVRTGSRHREL